MLRLPVGISDFKEMRCLENRNDIYYVDKTALVHEVMAVKDYKVLLITRPIRFMKSTNLSMLRYFFDIAHAKENMLLFDDLAIKTNPEYRATWEKYQGKYPVIYISFKNIKDNSWLDLYQKFVSQIKLLYEQHRILEKSELLNEVEKQQYQAILTEKSDFLPNFDDLDIIERKVKMKTLYQQSLFLLTKFLYNHYQKPVVILIDEYDAPLHSAYQHTDPQYRDLTTLEVSALSLENQEKCFFHQAREWMVRFLEPALKDNDTYLFKGVMTGVLRTAFASLISSLNNIAIHSVLSHQFADHFGITESELTRLCTDMGLTVDPDFKLEPIKTWYNGYQIGHAILYNPWSIAHYMTAYQKAAHFPNADSFIEPRAYWLQTGDSSVIGDYGRKLFSKIESDLVQLVQRKEIEVDIDERTVFRDLEHHDESAFWGLLLHAGYLTVRKISFVKGSRFSCMLTIPNREVLGAYMTFIERWYNDAAYFATDIDFGSILKSLQTGQLDYFKDRLERYMLSVVSYLDIPKKTVTIPKTAKTVKNKRGKKKAETFEEEIVMITPEQMYHLFMLGFVAGLNGHYEVQSNRESGYGRYDLILLPKKLDQHGIIFEFKAVETPIQLERYSQKALTQIQTECYQTVLQERGVKRGLHIGIAFCGKRLHISSEWCDYRPA